MRHLIPSCAFQPRGITLEEGLLVSSRHASCPSWEQVARRNKGDRQAFGRLAYLRSLGPPRGAADALCSVPAPASLRSPAKSGRTFSQHLAFATEIVALYPATSESEKISFNQLNKQTGHCIKYMKVDADTGEEVPRGHRQGLCARQGDLHRGQQGGARERRPNIVSTKESLRSKRIAAIEIFDPENSTRFGLPHINVSLRLPRKCCHDELWGKSLRRGGLPPPVRCGYRLQACRWPASGR